MMEVGKLGDLSNWIRAHTDPRWIWHTKYLSANDTYAKRNVHQAGPYLSKSLLQYAFLELSRRSRTERNPDTVLPTEIASHGWSGDIRAVWYNSRIVERRSNGRDEARLTQWGGRNTPIVTPEATGSLVVFAFELVPDGDPATLSIWLCDSPAEEEEIIDLVGDVEPGAGILWSPEGVKALLPESRGTCILASDEIPLNWLEQFPSGEEIIDWVLRNRDPWRGLTPDQRLLRRRKCEFDVFCSIEREHVLPKIRNGFDSVDNFLAFSHSVSNRRKSRAGRSLELHVKAILNEEKIKYSWTPRTEGKRSPDFIFPSIEDYHDSAWPSSRLFMLAAKTTCKDRWRQILNEAERIEVKHLITLQEGVSISQFSEMKEENVRLVVPRSLIRFYPEEIQPELMSLQDFLYQLSPTT